MFAYFFTERCWRGIFYSSTERFRGWRGDIASYEYNKAQFSVLNSAHLYSIGENTVAIPQRSRSDSGERFRIALAFSCACRTALFNFARTARTALLGG